MLLCVVTFYFSILFYLLFFFLCESFNNHFMRLASPVQCSWVLMLSYYYYYLRNSDIIS